MRIFTTHKKYDFQGFIGALVLKEFKMEKDVVECVPENLIDLDNFLNTNLAFSE